MKFVYVVSNQMSVIEVARIHSERCQILKEILALDFEAIKEKNISVKFDLEVLQNKIRGILIERKNMQPDIPDYKGRFEEDNIFVKKEFEDETLVLCNTGFDNKIIFLLNIYNFFHDVDISALGECKLYFINNHREAYDLNLKI